MARGVALNRVTSAARTTTGNSGTLSISDPAADFLSVAVNCTAASGTAPTLTVSVEWSTDGGATFYPADTADVMTAITAAGKAIKQFPVKAPSYRVVWTIGGTTPSFTFTVDEYAR